MLLPSGMTTTTITVGTSKTSTGGPVVFTGAAPKNAGAGWAVAGGMAVMGLVFL
jgi:hypothetical protein